MSHPSPSDTRSVNEPVLALNLRADGDTPGGARAALAAERGEPVHLSLRLPLRVPPRRHVVDRGVFVCENPSVVPVAADRLGARCAPLVCPTACRPPRCARCSRSSVPPARA